MAPVSLLTSFLLFEPVNKASERLMQKRHPAENTVFSRAFIQKVTTLISYQNQRCWVALNPNFDTMVGGESFVMCGLSRNKTQEKREELVLCFAFSIFPRIPYVLFSGAMSCSVSFFPRRSNLHFLPANNDSDINKRHPL